MGKLGGEEQTALEGRSYRTTMDAYSCNLSVVEPGGALPWAPLSSKQAEQAVIPASLVSSCHESSKAFQWQVPPCEFSMSP